VRRARNKYESRELPKEGRGGTGLRIPVEFGKQCGKDTKIRGKTYTQLPNFKDGDSVGRRGEVMAHRAEDEAFGCKKFRLGG